VKRQRGSILITGGAGFIGCNLADRLASEGRDVIVFDALRRPGVDRNLAWLKARHPGRIEAVIADVRDANAVTRAMRGARAVFHLAAQVAVTTSLHDPIEDFDINVRGTLNILEAARHRDDGIPVIFASTNKVYGDLGELPLTLVKDAYHPQDIALRRAGIGRSHALSFHSPYGCSKGAADSYVLDYARSFGLPTCVLRMSCIYGERQLGTEDQGWVAHFVACAMAGRPITIYGDGRQVRDILNVADAVDAYVAALEHIDAVSGRAFNLGGGPGNAVSLRQLLAHIEALLGRKVTLSYGDWRVGDQRYYVTDARETRRELALGEPLDWQTGVRQLAQWLRADQPRRLTLDLPTVAAS
jgi:CDP-paratose 2-epimerase